MMTAELERLRRRHVPLPLVRDLIDPRTVEHVVGQEVSVAGEDAPTLEQLREAGDAQETLPMATDHQMPADPGGETSVLDRAG